MEPSLPQVVPDNLPLQGSSSGTRCASGGLKSEATPPRTATSVTEQDQNELLDNEITKAFNTAGSRRPSVAAMNMLQTLNDAESGGPVDWTKPKNTERLLTLRKMIKNLFWALQRELENDEKVAAREDESLYRQNVPAVISLVVRHAWFGYFYLVWTIYALFGPDLLACFGHTPLNEDNLTLAVVNTVVLVLFILEEVLNSVVFRGYVCSLRFWIDTLATFSIAGDSLIGTEFLQSDAFVAMRGSRLTKILRVGGRSSKFVRFLRMARNLQLLRFVPKLNDIINRSTNELAFTLWTKRMRHVFTFLDDDGVGELKPVDVHFFNTAMEVEFPPQEQPRPFSLFRPLRAVQQISPSTAEKRVVFDGPVSFVQLLQEFMTTPLGKRTFARCRQDINSMKESCALVEQASDRLTLKVCILVLMLLITMQLLMSTTDDTSRDQGLLQVDYAVLHPDMSPIQFCEFVTNEFARVARDATFLLLIANYRVYWEPGCHCCDPEASASASAIVKAEEDITILEKVKASTGLEDHEILIKSIEDSAGSVRTLAVFDNHNYERDLAVNSVLQTVLVVILLTALVIYFATDMRKLTSRNVLHPLWNLMDDMCTVKNIDVLFNSQRGEKAVDEAQIKMLHRKYFLTSSSSLGPFCKCNNTVQTADELLQLRTAFDKLQVAMTSWSKYVPLILLKGLFEAHVEAKLGCNFEEIAVVFLAIKDFEHVCENMSAQQVLDLMSGVLNAIHEALDGNGGTMLEFIGDEVLAIFNAPRRLPTFQSNAIASVLQAQEFVGMLGSQVRLASSVHRARVLAGNLGSPTRMKYGVLGDGVNLTARLKSLNSRYGTHLLVSSDAMDFPGSEERFLARPVGDLILKGRNTPTRTWEVLAELQSATSVQIEAVKKHKQAFELYRKRNFAEAKAIFEEVVNLMASNSSASSVDRVAKHFVGLCDQFLENPPPDSWDGSEKLVKKAF